MGPIVSTVLTRRDQVQAYRFAQARVQSALLGGQPDRRDLPLRRQGLSVFAGVMIGVLVVCGFGMYGLIRPGNKQGWQAQGTLVVEKETGARYVYDPGDRLLHPVLNYASARLILNVPRVTVRQFSQASLVAAPRGAPRGLVGLPDAIPEPKRLLTGPWIVCSGGGDGPNGMTLTLGAPPSGQRLDRDHGMLVELPDRSRYLLWNDLRLQVTQPYALTALGLDRTTPVRVAKTWVNAVAPGPDLVAPAMPGLGTRTRYRVGAQPASVGQVFTVEIGGGPGYYVALADGLKAVRDPVALLLLGNPQLRVAYGNKSPVALPSTASDVAAAPRSAASLVLEGMPEQVPDMVRPDVGASETSSQRVCAAYTDTSGRSTASAVYVQGPQSSAPVEGAPAGSGTRVVVPAGRAALIELQPHRDQRSGSVFLVTDAGAKFPVPTADVQKAIGLTGVVPVPVAVGIAELIPTGPSMDQTRVNVDLPAEAKWMINDAG